MTDFYTKQFSIIKKHTEGNVKDTSIKCYLQAIKKLCRELFASETCSLVYFNDHNSVIDYIKTKVKSVSTRKNIVTAIIVILKANNKKHKEYSLYQKELANEQQDSYLDNIKTDKEEKNWITGKEITDILDQKLVLLKDFKGSDRQYADVYQQYLVLNLYTQLPPIRNDFALTKIVDIKDFDVCKVSNDTNYINLHDNTFVLCNYKTSKTYGTKKIDIPNDLMKIINKFEDIKKEKLSYTGDAFLINTTNKESMNKNTLTKYLNKIFYPKKVSTTLIRKCYLSEKYPIIHTHREREKDADIMGHNIGTAQSVYTKKL
jgi:uncharacterized protein (DUF1330 family)